MNRTIRFLSIAGVSCLIAGPALAQSPSPTVVPQSPSESRPGASTDPSVPSTRSNVQSPRERDYSPGKRANQNVQSPRENQDVQSPRANQNVQAPRENQDLQSPRENQNVQAPRDNQNVQSPRANQDLQSPGRYHASRGGSIRSGQEALKAKGLDPGEIDGRYGPKTQAAITEYQRKNGLRETGRFDQATLGQLGVGSERADTTGSPSRRN